MTPERKVTIENLKAQLPGLAERFSDIFILVDALHEEEQADTDKSEDALGQLGAAIDSLHEIEHSIEMLGIALTSAIAGL
jgi:hypothetical protein